MRQRFASASILAMTALFASIACEDANVPMARSDGSARDARTSSTTDASPQLDAGGDDAETPDGSDGSMLSCDGATCGPACIKLAGCCSELPVAVFGQSCATAAAGDEAACQMIVDQAHGIDRCLDPTDGGR